MAWRRIGDKPLSEPNISWPDSLTHINGTRGRWVKFYPWTLRLQVVIAKFKITTKCLLSIIIVSTLSHLTSSWANGGPHAPPMILHEWYHFVQGTLRNHISDVTRKNKLGLTTSFGHFSKWPPQNLRFPIYRKLFHVGSWFGSLNLYFLGQGIR